MIVTIESIKEVTETSKKPGGRQYQATICTGLKMGYKGAPNEPWEKKFLNFKHGEFIEIIKSIGVGKQMLIKSQQDQRGFWEVVSVEPYGAGGSPGAASSAPKKQNPEAPEQAPGGSPPREFPVFYPQNIPMNSRFVACLKVATPLVLGMMEHSQNFEKLIKRTATPELVKQMILETALFFYHNDPEFIKVKQGNEEGGTPEVPDVPGVPGEDPSPQDGDPEIPF